MKVTDAIQHLTLLRKDAQRIADIEWQAWMAKMPDANSTPYGHRDNWQWYSAKADAYAYAIQLLEENCA